MLLFQCNKIKFSHEKAHIVGQESKPRSSDFYQTTCHGGNIKPMAYILSNSRSSRQIRTPLKCINHASKCHIYERYHHVDAHFTELLCFAMKKTLKMS